MYLRHPKFENICRELELTDFKFTTSKELKDPEKFENMLCGFCTFFVAKFE
jgi:hypothetical protein